MRRTSVLWAAGLALTSAAWAQDRSAGVTIYGIVDAGLEYARTSAGATTPASSAKSVVTGSQSASRLGIRVTEDLGDGLRASAVLEHGFNTDTGGVTGAAFWGRNSYVGLEGRFGEIRLGRTYTPGFWVLLGGDVNRLGFYGNAGGFARLGATGQTRAANGVNYISPDLGGFVMRATYAFGESSLPPSDAGRVIAVAGEYSKGPMYAGVFHHVRRDVYPPESTTSESTRFSGASARYDFGVFTVGGGLARFDPAGPNSAVDGVTNSWWVGASIRAGVGDIRVTGGRLRTDLAAGQDARGTMFGVAYNHPLSRRTSLYATLGSMDNNDTGRFALEASSRAVALPISGGADVRGIAAGVRHAF